MRWSRRLLLLGLSPELSSYSTSLPSYCYGQAIFSTPTPISSITTTTITTQPTPSFQDFLKNFSFPSLLVHSALDSSSISLSSPPSYSDFLSSLAAHTSMVRPASSLSFALTSPLPSSLPPPYSIYRPMPIYTSSRPSSFSMGSIPYHLFCSFHQHPVSVSLWQLLYQGLFCPLWAHPQWSQEKGH